MPRVFFAGTLIALMSLAGGLGQASPGPPVVASVSETCPIGDETPVESIPSLLAACSESGAAEIAMQVLETWAASFVTIYGCIVGGDCVPEEHRDLHEWLYLCVLSDGSCVPSEVWMAIHLVVSKAIGVAP